MSKVLEHNLLKEYLVKFSRGKLNLERESDRKFLEGLAGSIMMLVPEAVAHLIQAGKEDDPETVYVAMAAIGATLKEVGERNIEIIQNDGGRDENTNLLKFAAASKLYN